MNLHGHFEKGAWVSGPMDSFIEAGRKISEGCAPAMANLGKSLQAFMEIELSGRFVQGRWESVTIRDLTEAM